MIDLSIIIVSFNTKALLAGLLSSSLPALKKAKEKGFASEVIVVDNNSSDQTAKHLKKYFGWVKLIINRANVGFSAACNQGILASRGKYILLLNSDTKVYPDTLEKIMIFASRFSGFGGATCKVVLPDGKIDPASHRGFPTPWNSFCYFSGLEKIFPRSRSFSGYHQGWKNKDKVHQIDCPSGAFFLVKRSVVDKIGVLDDKFFMYGEDIDWAFRIKKAGFGIYWYPGTQVLHLKKQSGRAKIGDRLARKMARKYFWQTMKLFYQKHYFSGYPWVTRQLVYAGIWLASKMGR